MLAATAAVGGAAYRLGGRRLGLLAAAILFAQPFVVWEAMSTLVEGRIALTVMLAV